MEGIKEENVTSDRLNPTMLAKQRFDHILEQVQTSCLNFHLQVSPFSAVISIKKSLVIDKSGQVFMPPQPRKSPININELLKKNKNLENDVVNLTKLYEDSVNECERAYDVIKSLQQKDLEAKSKSKEEVKSKSEMKLSAEISDLKRVLEDRDREIVDLKVLNKAAREASEKLNNKIGEIRTKYNEEKAEVLRKHKIEIKSWKKDLGEANSKVIKLEKKLKALANEHESCSLLLPNAPCIANLQTLASGQEVTSSRGGRGDENTGHRCNHTPVCITRQPHPPPYPSITHIVNERSKYHEHMMSSAGVPGRYPGHEKCMNAYSNNYGCEDCIWLKWFGEIHGYPDIHPADFKKYLEAAEWEIVRSRM